MTLARVLAARLLAALAGGLAGGASLAAQPGIEAIDHVGLSTVDIERSIHFYRDLLGMELTERDDVNDRVEYNRIFGLAHVKAKGAMLRLGAMQIELFEFVHPKGRPPDLHRPVNDPRIYHICFVVKDIDKEYARLKAAGVPFHHPPQDFGVAKAVYGRDPDGNVVELLQWPATKVEAPH
jgi:catechol 2,3-dioxygenase-like lactoylglutathione lyase family enzyme